MRRPPVHRFFIVSILVPALFPWTGGGSARAYDPAVSTDGGLRGDYQPRGIDFEHLWTYEAGG